MRRSRLDNCALVFAVLFISAYAIAAVGLLVSSVDVWRPADSTVGVRYSTGAFITPTPYPISYLPPPAPAYEYDLIDMNAINRDFWVCDIETAVRGAPGDIFPVIYTLHYGDEVQIGELSNGYGQWYATLGRAQWIAMDSLCRQ